MLLTKESLGPQAERIKFDTGEILTAEDIEGLTNGTRAIFAYGEAHYTDAFGSPRFVRYRQFNGGPLSIRRSVLFGHPDGNEAN